VWIIADTIVNGSESGTSARQKLYFQEIGFNIHHTMIMDRAGLRFSSKVRYGTSLEYAFILSKGKPRTISRLRDRPNKRVGKKQSISRREPDGWMRPLGKSKPVAEMGYRRAIWQYSTGWKQSTLDDFAFKHPALMHEDMARDHIVSWSRPSELVFDPMAGAGTTCKMALLNNRRYLGFEIHEPYFRIAVHRLREAHQQYRERLDDWFLRPSLDDRLRGLLGNSYNIIYADPPWPFKSWGSHPKGRSVENHYRTLSLRDIKSLPVERLAGKDSVLFMWTTGPFLREAQAVIEAWGFDYKTIGFSWIKTRSGSNELHMGNGYHTRANAELCHLATRGRGLPRVRRDVRQVVVAPVGRHSEKPEEVRLGIEALYGPQRRIELFARRKFPGWDAEGDGIDGQDIRQVLLGA
jgi:N6-adenosine-specific RNA methylase IME4